MAPLAGIRVLELGRVLAGPFCGMLLADLGAEVIKVEPPQGDDARTFGPFVRETSTYHRLLNRGKLGISLDLKRPDDLQVLRELLARTDVLVENFRPGTLGRSGCRSRTSGASTHASSSSASPASARTGHFATCPPTISWFRRCPGS